MYRYYYFSGGIYASAKFSTRIKCSWFCVCLLVIFFHIGGAIGYLLTTESLDVLDVVSIWSFSIAVSGLLVGVSSLTHYYHENFEQILSFIGSRRRMFRLNGARQESMIGKLIKWRDPARGSLFWVKLVSGLMASYLMNYILDVNFYCSLEKPFHSLSHHMLAIPFMNRIPTFQVYWILYFMENVFINFIGIIMNSVLGLTMMIAIEFNNVVIDYCERLQMFTEFVSYGNNVSSADGKLSRIFEQKLKIFIRDYQKLLR